tara:strand:+ start:1697 stop:1942 length:246 start_codon:yes stop_codon:yes gene_type:complete
MSRTKIKTGDITDGAITSVKVDSSIAKTADVYTQAQVDALVITGAFPFYKANGIQDNIVLDTGALPFYKADGTQDNIGLAT